ncbi:MAG: phosphoribosylformylglycinamidine cyclo-ligase [Candidatus Buchananbacteria bacterium]|nr:phosphoribosylformylglycinamidine cyclo-ligase [Candidatus Buchananbacteria bacterium]
MGALIAAPPPLGGATYAQAGVDIDAGNSFARMVKGLIAQAWPEAAAEIGGFAGGGIIPVLSGVFPSRVETSTDGTGTKAILAALVEEFSGIGHDAVAMSAVDTYVVGAKPVYLLDNLDVARLEPAKHITIIESVIGACKLAGCKLVGGETAELPDLFKHPWMFNLNTSVVGFSYPSNGELFGPVAVKPGNLVYGWLSYGLGSNGFSLARKVFQLKDRPSRARVRLERTWPELGGQTLAASLLQPTPIYISAIEQQKPCGVKFLAHAHITGGGMVENIPRCLPPDCKVRIDRSRWCRPAIFSLIERLGNVDGAEMDRTLNQGLMMVSIVSQNGKPVVNPHAVLIGEVAAREGNEPQVELSGSYR